MAKVATLGKKLCPTKKNERTYLTPTGLLMEGDVTSLRRLFAFLEVKTRNPDLLATERLGRKYLAPHQPNRATSAKSVLNLCDRVRYANQIINDSLRCICQ